MLEKTQLKNTQLENTQLENAQNAQSKVSVNTPLTPTAIQDWLAEHIADQLGIEAASVDIDTPFHRYGLSSIQAMSVAQQGKERFGLELSPLVIWNFPTIASLSTHISETLNSHEYEMFEL